MAENDLGEKIEELAALQFTTEEIAKIMEMGAKKLLSQFQSSIDRGRLMAEAEVRRSILKLAKQGSTPAQKQFIELNAIAKKSSARK